MATSSDTKPQASADSHEPRESDAPAKPRYDEKIQGDSFEVLRRYQEITLPPNARLELMSAPLAMVPPEQLQDTVPPNAGVAPPAEGAAPPSGRATNTEAPVVDHSRMRDTMVLPRVRRQQRLRNVVLGAVMVAALLAAVGLLLNRQAPDEPATAAAQREAATARDAPTANANSPGSVPQQTPPAARVEQPASAVPLVPATGSGRSPELAPAAARATTEKSGTKTASKPTADKPPSAPVTTPKPAPAPGRTTDNGSAFDGLMRPPSD